MLDCMRQLRYDEKSSNQDARDRYLPSSSSVTKADAQEDSGLGERTPVPNKVPVCINLETPEMDLQNCPGSNSGNLLGYDFHQNYSSSPLVCGNHIVDNLATAEKGMPVVPLFVENNGSDDEEWDYNGLSCCQRIRRDSSYDGMTNSEDSRLCYGLSGYPECPPNYESIPCDSDKEVELEQQLYLDIEKFNPFVENIGSNDEMDKSPAIYSGCDMIGSDIILYNDGKTGMVEMFEGTGSHIVTLCGQEFDGGGLRSNSMFGLSPFAVDLTHADAPLGSVLKYSAIRNCKEDDKERTWFKHNHPREIEIKGFKLQLMFASINDFSKDVVTAIGRMFQRMDDELFLVFKERRFRHFLPPEFVDIVLAGRGVEEHDCVHQMFIGEHVAYAVSECKLVLLPVFIDSNWSLYIWNFERRTIVVIDPVKMVGGRVAVMRKHEEHVDKLHKAMTICKNKWFKYPGVLMVGWAKEFLAVEGAHGNRLTSGLYTMFYARYFDGTMLTRILTYESQDIQRCNILHQLLSLPNNVGELPEQIRTALLPVA